VRYHGAGAKHLHHGVVGDLELAYESVDMISEPALTLTLYAAEPASPSAHALALLASWASTEPAGMLALLEHRAGTHQGNEIWRGDCAPPSAVLTRSA
jgi:hypothetical protein